MFPNNIKVINLTKQNLNETVSSTAGGRFGDSPPVYLHNDDISALLNVTSHHPILTFTKCLQAEFEEKRG